MRIPDKPPGRTYAVILRTADFSWGRIAAIGAVGGSSTAPVPSAGAQCTCCDAPTERTQAIDPSTDRITVAPFHLPVCEVCADHALRSPLVEMLLGIGLVMLGALGGLGVLEHLAWLAGAGFGAVGLVIAFLLIRRARRIARAAAGHHAGLELGVHPGMTVVRTSNRRLVEELVARNGAAVKRVR